VALFKCPSLHHCCPSESSKSIFCDFPISLCSRACAVSFQTTAILFFVKHLYHLERSYCHINAYINAYDILYWCNIITARERLYFFSGSKRIFALSEKRFRPELRLVDSKRFLFFKRNTLKKKKTLGKLNPFK